MTNFAILAFVFRFSGGTVSNLLSVLEYFDNDEFVFNSPDHLNYGCNCYGTNERLSPLGIDTKSYGMPKDLWDKSCYKWKKCYQSTKRG